jgi:hypothetical protein
MRWDQPAIPAIRVNCVILIQKQVAVMATISEVVDDKDTRHGATQCLFILGIEAVMVDNEPIGSH